MKKAVKWWKDVPGYDGIYQVSRLGEIRRVLDNGDTFLMSQYKKAKKSAGNRLFVHLSKDGQRKEVPVAKIVEAAFKGETPPGMVLYHINGNVTDNCVENLGYITRSKLGKMTGAKANKRRTVLMIDKTGEVVEVYSSARQAAKDNYLSYQTVLDRCHNKVKNPFALTGFTFKFETKRGRPCQQQALS